MIPIQILLIAIIILYITNIITSLLTIYILYQVAKITLQILLKERRRIKI